MSICMTDFQYVTNYRCYRKWIIYVKHQFHWIGLFQVFQTSGPKFTIDKTKSTRQLNARRFPLVVDFCVSSKAFHSYQADEKVYSNYEYR